MKLPGWASFLTVGVVLLGSSSPRSNSRGSLNHQNHLLTTVQWGCSPQTFKQPSKSSAPANMLNYLQIEPDILSVLGCCSAFELGCFFFTFLDQECSLQPLEVDLNSNTNKHLLQSAEFQGSGIADKTHLFPLCAVVTEHKCWTLQLLLWCELFLAS